MGDGSRGWAEHAPFDKVLVAAAPDLIPTPLLTQLKPGGRMIVPAGLEDAQKLIEVEKSPEGQLRTFGTARGALFRPRDRGLAGARTSRP